MCDEKLCYRRRPALFVQQDINSAGGVIKWILPSLFNWKYKRRIAIFKKERSGNYQVVKMAMKRLCMQAGRCLKWMGTNRTILMPGNNIMEIRLGRTTDRKNQQQHGGQ